MENPPWQLRRTLTCSSRSVAEEEGRRAAARGFARTAASSGAVGNGRHVPRVETDPHGSKSRSEGHAVARTTCEHQTANGQAPVVAAMVRAPTWQ
jgi:hypothetical protein